MDTKELQSISVQNTIDWKTEEGFPGLGRKLRILAAPANEGGCAQYRVIQPYKKLAELYPNVVEVRFDQNPLGADTKTGSWIKDWEFENLKWCDVVVLNNLSNFGARYTARIVGKAKEFGKYVHYDTDDLLTDLYEGHRLYDVYKKQGLGDITKFIYNNSDLTTVTQTKFADRIVPYISKHLAVVRNCVDYRLPAWNQPKRETKFCKFGWAGGIHHEQDVRYFSGVPHLVNQRVGVKNCRWDLYGAPPPNVPKSDWQHEVWRNYHKIIFGGMKGAKNYTINYARGIEDYGVFFSLMDVALAPLEPNEFNDSKSEIKVAEAGRYKIPLVASNVGCYDEWIINGETGFLIDPAKGRSEWVKVLTRVAKDKKLRETMGENLHQVTEANFDLNKRVHDRLDIYKELVKVES